ncbi:unnamed protein product [Linum trigynum]|uniref:Uncharacterized protein n=1 Tax=Linum trigynum TaxID=586398 RepID=A0AAV2D2I8_9ROSI
MGLKVEITCTESIKPSSPTPHHLRTHNLTILDQTAPPCYVPLCLFYPNTSSSTQQRSLLTESLKGSLAKTLNVYYPLAGRYRDAFAVDCNDAGAEFVNARVVVGSMSDVVRQAPDDDVLVPLLPCRPRGRHVDSEGELVLLAVQVSFFDGCGGVSIGVCVWHGLADACTLAWFLATWSGFGGEGNGGDAVVHDCTAVFPPADLSVLGECMERPRAAVANTPGTRTKRFVFEGGKIAALKRGIEESSWRRQQRVAEPGLEISEKIPLRHFKMQQPTRVTAVAAVIWAARIKIARDNKKKKKKTRRDDVHIAAMTTNLRSRMNPGFSEHVMGNLVQIPVFAEWPLNDEAVENAAEHGGGSYYYGALAGKLRESVRNVTGESVRRAAVAGSGPSSFLGGLMRRFVEAHDGGNLLVISSWCRFPFYEVDFGLGKPGWICTFTMSHNLAVLMDAKDGEGIEAWVTLSADEMSEFENDDGIRQYATSSSNGVNAM